MSGRKRTALVLAVAGLALAIALGGYAILRPAVSRSSGASALQSDPRRSYAGPFRNVDPDIRYVPDGRCADCHAAIATAYAGHPMGRSLQPIRETALHAEGPPLSNTFEALGSRFLVEREGERVRHRRVRLDPAGRPAAEQDWEVHYVIGSGTRGYSYLTDSEGYLFQTPLSWYSQKQVWSLSPGFGPSHLMGRAVLPECLFCHANRAGYLEGSVNHYTQPVFDGHAIGCQRCHGPGELHVTGPDKGTDGIDPTIVNPKHLAPELRDAVCEQCHLQGVARVRARDRGLYDFRPGLPLALFWSEFMRVAEAGDGQKAVGQVEQMYQSRCFQGGTSTSRLGCISCHDPHERVPPAQRVAHYRERCVRCHQEQACRAPLADRLRRTAEDSCIDCHMPRYGVSDIPHTAASDHRILRLGPSSAVRGPSPRVRTADDGRFPIVSFYRGRKEIDDGEEERSRALAVVKLALGGDPNASRAVGHALPALEAALRRDPKDLPAGEANGYARSLLGASTEALTAFQAVLVQAPDRELALVGAALTAEALGQTDAALEYWRRAVAANPWAPGYRRSLVLLLVKKKAWDEAQPECQAWVRLEPISAEARGTRIVCLLATGQKEAARAEFARIEALAPTNLKELQIRFEKKMRKAEGISRACRGSKCAVNAAWECAIAAGLARPFA
jgi:Flp pilus assembly protein TadD